MRNIPNHIVLLFFCLITISCERERVYPFKHQSPLLSLHAIIEAGEDLEVKLAQTTNLTRSQEGGQLISTASFLIQWNEVVYQYDSLYSNNGIFVFPEINPKEGDLLALVAQSGNMEAKGEIRIPSRSLTQLKGVEVDESNLNPLVTVHLNLAESDQTTGPFMIYATGLLQDPQTGQIEKKRFKVKSSHNSIDQRTQSLAELPSDLLFIPGLNATDHSFNLIVSGIPATFSPLHPKQKLELIVEKLSPDLYEYYLTLYLSQELQDNEYTSEPFEIHSNIKGGVGVLGTYQRTSLGLYW